MRRDPRINVLEEALWYMFMIAAIIRPFRLKHVRSELLAAGIQGLTITECCGHGRQPEWIETTWCDGKIPKLLDKVKIEVAVRDCDLPVAIEAISHGARLGRIGDGKIFITSLERVVAIRTGAQDELALQAPIDFVEAAE